MKASYYFLCILSLAISTCYSDDRELIPLEAPSNLTLLEIRGRQVLIEWDPVDAETVRGHFRGYLVRTWNNAGSQVYAFPPDVLKANVEFFPHSKNFITVSARNEKYVGPPSDAISFDAPQIEPNLPYVLNVHQLSNKSVLLHWSKPTQPNGILLGYKIYCSEVNDLIPDEEINKVTHQISDPEKLQAKLTGLEEGVKYKIAVTALNCAGESESKTTQIVMEPHIPAPPFVPTFIYKINYHSVHKDEECYKPLVTVSPQDDDDAINQPKDYDYYDYLILNDTRKVVKKPATTAQPDGDGAHCLVDCMIQWLPDIRNNPGEYFYVKHRLRGEENFETTPPEYDFDFIILHQFDACKNHEIMVVAVDGEHETESRIQSTPTKIFA